MGHRRIEWRVQKSGFEFFLQTPTRKRLKFSESYFSPMQKEENEIDEEKKNRETDPDMQIRSVNNILRIRISTRVRTRFLWERLDSRQNFSQY